MRALMPRLAEQGKTPRRSLGFGLLEAVVALTLLAGVGGALFAWLSQSMQTAARLQEAQIRTRMMSDVEQMLSQVNPYAAPQGELALGKTRMTWTSRLISPMRYSVPYSTNRVRWRVGLYQISIQAKDLDGDQVLQLDAVQTGLHDLAPPVPPDAVKDDGGS